MDFYGAMVYTLVEGCRCEWLLFCRWRWWVAEKHLYLPAQDRWHHISEESKFNIHYCENYRPYSQLLRVFQFYTLQKRLHVYPCHLIQVLWLHRHL